MVTEKQSVKDFPENIRPILNYSFNYFEIWNNGRKIKSSIKIRLSKDNSVLAEIYANTGNAKIMISIINIETTNDISR